MALTIRDLAWAAGFLEGEGTFVGRATSKEGRVYYPIRISAIQVQREPLERLQRIFGGPITSHIPRQPNRQDYFIWQLCGSKGVAVMMTVYVLMSPRRKSQIADVIEVWKARLLPSKERKTCPQGHPFDRIWYRRGKPRRECSICHTQSKRRQRLMQRGQAANANQLRLLN